MSTIGRRPVTLTIDPVKSVCNWIFNPTHSMQKSLAGEGLRQQTFEPILLLICKLLNKDMTVRLRGSFLTKLLKRLYIYVVAL